jgi:hypothetical protein
MRREDLKAHEIGKRIIAKDCVNTVIIPMTLLREEAGVSLERPFSKVISLRLITTHARVDHEIVESTNMISLPARRFVRATMSKSFSILT